MIAPTKPTNETERLSDLYDYKLLDTLPEKEYDDITKIAADICGMPISLITLIDNERQWFKSQVGIDGTETDRDLSFCAHAILTSDEVFVVGDAKKDERFFDNPYVTGSPFVGFYAGVPLVNENGHALGSLCVLDSKPNSLSPEQRETLKALARQVVVAFEMRKLNAKLAEQKTELQSINDDLSRFAHMVAHDVKSPCSSLAMSVDYFKDTYSDKLDADGKQILDMMGQTSMNAIRMVDGILAHTTTVNNNEVERTKFTFGSMVEEARSLLVIPDGFSFGTKDADVTIYTSRYMLLQVLLNLSNNAIKYNDKDKGSVVLSVKERNSYYEFSVTDNGPGIRASDQARIFDMFSTLGVLDRFKNRGTGIGLATVKRLIEKMEGTIVIESEMGKGSTFRFTFRK